MFESFKALSAYATECRDDGWLKACLCKQRVSVQVDPVYASSDV